MGVLLLRGVGRLCATPLPNPGCHTSGLDLCRGRRDLSRAVTTLAASLGRPAWAQDEGTNLKKVKKISKNNPVQITVLVYFLVVSFSRPRYARYTQDAKWLGQLSCYAHQSAACTSAWHRA
ncbi:hypothetical protein AAFN86_18955 [Roseomonas sp. CAU 1739]|uniref:hypothetical protein n=1 Tax=Roseomonas sp. CAU 1739 TaxID=3140364 RepID=UPI00325B7E8E